MHLSAKDALKRRRPRRCPWSGKVKRFKDLSADEIELWRYLVATRHELRSPFFSFEFARAVAEAGARARVCVLYEGGALAGFFPFQYAGAAAQAAGVGERIGGSLSGVCGIIMDPSKHPPIGADDLVRCAGLGSLALGNLEEKQQKLSISGTQTQSARVVLGSDLETYWKSVKSRHWVAFDNLRNRQRKLKREFNSVEFTFAHSEPTRLLDLLITEKREQYRRKNAVDLLEPIQKVVESEESVVIRYGGVID